jgi:hypothetical protein
VGDVGRDSRGAGDIVERERGDERVQLHEERQRLADTAGRAEDGHLPLRLPGGRGVAAAATEEPGGGSHHRRPHCGLGVGVPRRRVRSGSGGREGEKCTVSRVTNSAHFVKIRRNSTDSGKSEFKNRRNTVHCFKIYKNQ